MTEVHQAAAGGKGADPSSARGALRRFVKAAHVLRDAWAPELEGPTQPRSLPSFGVLVRELDAWLADVEARPPAASEIPPLDLGDHDAVRGWLTELRAQINDIAAAGEDATRPPGQRELGRATARNAILEARDAIGQIMAAAERGTRGPGG
jgi:hypothetical protein